MTMPAWMLLAFAVWTLLLLAGTVGWFRLSRIAKKQAKPHEFRADQVEGPDFYKRAMRAHMNCVENLPVFAAIVVAALAAGVDTPTLDTLAVVLVVARVGQSLVHVSVPQTANVVSLRFLLFATQLACMLGMAAVIALTASAA